MRYSLIRATARDLAIQTLSSLPTGWAGHVLADGHWGRAMREYVRDVLTIRRGAYLTGGARRRTILEHSVAGRGRRP